MHFFCSELILITLIKQTNTTFVNLRGAFICFIFATPILVRKSVLIEWCWDCYQLKGLISSFFRSLVKISRSLSQFGIFTANKEEGVSQLFLKFRSFNYQYSIWIISNLWPIWIMLLSVLCFNIMKFNLFRIVSYYCYIGFLLFCVSLQMLLLNVLIVFIYHCQHSMQSC